jgi:hypothetical protein
MFIWAVWFLMIWALYLWFKLAFKILPCFLLMASSGCYCVLLRFFCDPDVTAVESWAAIGVFDWEFEITIEDPLRFELFACLELLNVRLFTLEAGPFGFNYSIELSLPRFIVEKMCLRSIDCLYMSSDPFLRSKAD